MDVSYDEIVIRFSFAHSVKTTINVHLWIDWMDEIRSLHQQRFFWKETVVRDGQISQSEAGERCTNIAIWSTLICYRGWHIIYSRRPNPLRRMLRPCNILTCCARISHASALLAASAHSLLPAASLAPSPSSWRRSRSSLAWPCTAAKERRLFPWMNELVLFELIGTFARKVALLTH